MQKERQAAPQTVTQALSSSATPFAAADLEAKLRIYERKMVEISNKLKEKEQAAEELGREVVLAKKAQKGSDLEIKLMQKLVQEHHRCTEYEAEASQSTSLKTELEEKYEKEKQARELAEVARRELQDLRTQLAERLELTEMLKEVDPEDWTGEALKKVEQLTTDARSGKVEVARRTRENEDLKHGLDMTETECNETIKLLERAVDLKEYEKQQKMAKVREIGHMKTKQKEEQEAFLSMLGRVEEQLAGLGSTDQLREHSSQTVRQLILICHEMRQLVKKRADRSNVNGGHLARINEER